MPSVQHQREKLIDLLKQLFQLDQPDLDFGFYKIMHAKSEQVQRFLENDLLDIIKQEFGDLDGNRVEEAKTKYEQALEQAKKFGAPNPDETDGVKEAKAEYDNAKQGGSPEGEIYDHLWRFFERYYDNGDFLSRRYYARETTGKAAPYAIPYDGREVYLHWANKDQYYIKTSEYLSNFTFNPTQSKEYKEQAGELLPDDEQGLDNLKVHCRIVEATEGEHGNIKTSEGQQRYFIIHAAEPVKLENNELIVQFQYRPDPEKTGQDNTWKQKRYNQAVETVMKTLGKMPEAKAFFDVLNLPAPTEKQKDRPLLAKYLTQYTARNSMDYFIHKDLGGFLNRELDFYIKNEIMRLDDIEHADAPAVESYLAKIRVLRKIAKQLIEFLAQLENFQKKLWLKKKFVTEVNYCITLDRVPEEFYPEIAANEEQRKEWVKLFAIDELKGDLAAAAYSEPLTADFLKENASLIVDTVYFGREFKNKFLATLHEFDDQLEGTLINGDNFQSICFLYNKDKGLYTSVYLDPPYNTDASSILYKNNYKDSSWLSMMLDRMSVTSELMSKQGMICLAIDDEELIGLKSLLSNQFCKEIGTAPVRSNPQSRKTKGKFSPTHEYALFYGKSEDSIPCGLGVTENRLARYPHTDSKGRFAWMNFIRTGSNDKREDRPKLYYPIFVNEEDLIRIPDMEWDQISSEYKLKESPKDSEKVVFPVSVAKGKVVEKNWHRGFHRVSSEPDEYRVRRADDGSISIDFKTRMDSDSLPITWWDSKEYASANYGASELKRLFGEKNFDFPKAKKLVRDCLTVIGANEPGAMVLDYFGGSGTTAHALLDLARQDEKRRKYTIVEMGDHFDSVVRPRVKKVIYSKDWKEGKPESREGLSHGFKYIRLESYEDALNNLSLDDSANRNQTVKENESLRRDYMLKYWLDMETQGSPSLLNIEQFVDPTAYTLKVKKPGTDEYEDKPVDLIETFNWLIGLHVEHMDIWRGFDAQFKREKDPELPKDGHTKLVIDGKLKETQDEAFALRKIEGWTCRTPGNTEDREKVLVVWRKLSDNLEEDNAVLDEWFRKLDIRSRDSEFDIIYVNGSNNLPNLRREDEHWKVRLLEETFHQKMWDIEGL
ncbi:MAG: DNA methyltransferase [Candidatus Thiodiazotropha endolucinida]